MIALPGTNGFVGEFLILLGTWKANKIAAGVAGLGVILGAVYMLLMVQKMMFGKVTHEVNRTLKDLSFREIAVLLPLLVAAIGMEILPNFFFEKMNVSINHFIQRSTSAVSFTAASFPIKK